MIFDPDSFERRASLELSEFVRYGFPKRYPPTVFGKSNRFASVQISDPVNHSAYQARSVVSSHIASTSPRNVKRYRSNTPVETRTRAGPFANKVRRAKKRRSSSPMMLVSATSKLELEGKQPRVVLPDPVSMIVTTGKTPVLETVNLTTASTTVTVQTTTTMVTTEAVETARFDESSVPIIEQPRWRNCAAIGLSVHVV